MELTLQTLALATLLVFLVSVVFAAMGLGGSMLYVPILTWLGVAVKIVWDALNTARGGGRCRDRRRCDAVPSHFSSLFW